MKKIVLLLLAMAVLSGCMGIHAVSGATLRDTIFSVEPRANGVVVMWMTHDDVGAYCTVRPEVAKKMQDYLLSGSPVIVTYKSLNVGDEGYSLLGGCSAEGSRTTMYVVTDIRLPDGAK